MQAGRILATGGGGFIGNNLSQELWLGGTRWKVDWMKWHCRLGD